MESGANPRGGGTAGVTGAGEPARSGPGTQGEGGQDKHGGFSGATLNHSRGSEAASETVRGGVQHLNCLVPVAFTTYY